MSSFPDSAPAPAAGEQARYALLLTLMIPVFLPAAGNDPEQARQAAIDALDGCEAVSMAELEAAARAICLEHAALDSLGRSMSPGLTDSQRTRYRNQAVTLTRTAARTREMFRQIQARRRHEDGRVREAEAPAPEPAAEPPLWAAGAAAFPLGMEAMKRASRAMLADVRSWQADDGPPHQVPPDACPFGLNDSPPDRPAP